MVTPDKLQKIYRLFLEEAGEHLERMNAELLAFEENALDTDALDSVLRAAHSIKGTAGATGLSSVEAMMHNFETCAVALKEQKDTVGPEGFDLLYRLLDAIEAEAVFICTGKRRDVQVVPENLELKKVFGAELRPYQMNLSAQTEQKSSKPSAGNEAQEALAVSVSRDEGSTLRVQTDKIDRLMNCVEELLQVKAGGKRREQELLAMEHAVENIGRIADSVRQSVRELSGDNTRVLRLVEDLRKQQELASRIAEEIAFEGRKAAHTLSGLSERLHDDIRSVRMVPIEHALLTVPRLVRDVSRQLGRAVSFRMQGEKTEVDRDLVELLKDPIIHLLRNAIAHGGESSEDRVKQGKDATMQLSLEAVGRAGGLDVVVRDDGAGVNLEKIRKKAVEVGLLVAQDAARISDEDLLQLIFVPGFSTAAEIDSISGRGFGLDVVRERIEACGGSVVIQSKRGRGTEFVLRLPLSLSSMRMLLCQVGPRHFALPVAAVQRVVRIAPDDVKQVDGGLACTVAGRPVAVDRLGNLLGVPLSDVSPERSPAIVLSSGAASVALVVDSIFGEQELIVKKLGDQLVRVQHVAGVTVLSDGEIVPLLNVSDLVRSLSTQSRQVELFSEQKQSKTKKKRILIADDSITTRTLEKSILEAAGYSVDVATDGVHALEKLGQGPFDLVLSDFQMPKMDGLALVAAIKADDRYRKIPVVLVSSISAQEDKKRGLLAGADAYLGKQEFSQELLLQTLERLL